MRWQGPDAGWTVDTRRRGQGWGLPAARRPALQREVGRRVPSFCRLSDGRLRWMFRLIVKSPGRRGPQQKRAPREDTRLPDGRPVDTVPRCLPLGIASLLLGLDWIDRCVAAFTTTVAMLNSPPVPPSNVPFASSPWADPAFASLLATPASNLGSSPRPSHQQP